MKRGIAIESNIPAPKHGNGGTPKYPFRSLKKGQSFFIPIETAHSMTVRSSAYAFVHKNAGFKLKVAKTTNPDGCRVWRL